METNPYLTDDTINSQNKESPTQNHSGLIIFVSSCLGIMLTFCLILILVFFPFLNYLLSIDSDENKEVFRSGNAPGKPEIDLSRDKRYELFVSLDHKLSFYYPDTHIVVEKDSTIEMKTFTSSFDSYFSPINTTLINYNKYSAETPQTNIEFYLRDEFRDFEKINSQFLPKNLIIQGNTINSLTYEDKVINKSKSIFVENCMNESKEIYEILPLNTMITAIINYSVGKVCDNSTGIAQIPLRPDQKELDLTVGILKSISYDDYEIKYEEYKKSYDMGNLKNNIVSTENKYGIKIYYQNFPISILNNKNRVLWTQIDPKQIDNDNAFYKQQFYILVRELNKYPQEFFRKIQLKNIALVSGLQVTSLDYPVAGTVDYVNDTMYIDINKTNSSWELQRVLHHEIMHAIDLLRPYINSDNLRKWDALNDPGFTYAKSANLLDSLEYSVNNLNTIGFISGYGKVNIYEDRAEVYCAIMTPRYQKYYSNRLNEDKVIKAKLIEIKRYIKAEIPQFTEEFLNNLNYN